MKRRSELLRNVGQERSLAFRGSLTGEELEVLVLDRAVDDGHLRGLASEYVNTTFDGPASLANHFVSVRVTGVDGPTTHAALIPGSER